MQNFYKSTCFFFSLLIVAASYGQQGLGIGTTTPDNQAALDIVSTQKGVRFPALNAAQQTTLAGMLGPSEVGMVITDQTTGKLLSFNGTAFQSFTPANPLTAVAPLSVTTNNVQLNPGTAAGDLLTWDGTNWINAQPATQHWSYSIDNHQPFLTINFCISLFGIFPTQSDASQPYVGEIIMMGSNFAPVGWQFCDGSILSIAENTVLFDLIGTTYGGDGLSTFAVPDLRSRIPVHMGSNGTSTYTIGQSFGVETNTFSH